MLRNDVLMPVDDKGELHSDVDSGTCFSRWRCAFSLGCAVNEHTQVVAVLSHRILKKVCSYTSGKHAVINRFGMLLASDTICMATDILNEMRASLCTVLRFQRRTICQCLKWEQVLMEKLTARQRCAIKLFFCLSHVFLLLLQASSGLWTRCVWLSV